MHYKVWNANKRVVIVCDLNNFAYAPPFIFYKALILRLKLGKNIFSYRVIHDTKRQKVVTLAILQHHLIE